MYSFNDTGGEAHGQDYRHRAIELLMQREAFTKWWHRFMFTKWLPLSDSLYRLDGPVVSG